MKEFLKKIENYLWNYGRENILHKQKLLIIKRKKD